MKQIISLFLFMIFVINSYDMSKFLKDIRDYIYIIADYNYRSISYWIYCFGLIFFYYLGFFLLIAILMPADLVIYISRTRHYSALIQVFNYLILIAPASLLAIGFDYLSINHPLPSREDITPRVFRRKLLNTYFFLFLGLVFTAFCAYLFLKIRFGN